MPELTIEDLAEKAGYQSQLVELGCELVYTSDSGSFYYHIFFGNDSTTVRVSDHSIPETEERSEGKGCYDYQLLYGHGFEDDNKETLEFLVWLKNEKTK